MAVHNVTRLVRLRKFFHLLLSVKMSTLGLRPRVDIFNFGTYYIRMSHWPSCIICIMSHHVNTFTCHTMSTYSHVAWHTMSTNSSSRCFSFLTKSQSVSNLSFHQLSKSHTVIQFTMFSFWCVLVVPVLYFFFFLFCIFLFFYVYFVYDIDFKNR